MTIMMIMMMMMVMIMVMMMIIIIIIMVQYVFYEIQKRTTVLENKLFVPFPTVCQMVVRCTK